MGMEGRQVEEKDFVWLTQTYKLTIRWGPFCGFLYLFSLYHPEVIPLLIKTFAALFDKK